MATGKDNRAMAAGMFRTVRPADKHLNSIFAKLGLGEEPEVHEQVKAVLHLAG